MESSLCTSHVTVKGAHASPAALCRRAGVPMLLHWRTCAVRGAHAQAPDLEASAKEGHRVAKAAVRAGVSVALALALGGVTWASRGAGPGATPGAQPAVCLSSVADSVSRPSERSGAAAMKATLDALSDSVFRRDDAPRERSSLMDHVYEQVTKEVGDRGKLTSLLHKEWSASRDAERKLDLGLLLTAVLINQREWQRAKEICQQLTGRYQRDSRPYLHLAVIHMMIALENMLSPDTASIEEIEKMSKNAMDSWKEFKNKYDLSKGSTDASA